MSLGGSNKPDGSVTTKFANGDINQLRPNGAGGYDALKLNADGSTQVTVYANLANTIPQSQTNISANGFATKIDYAADGVTALKSVTESPNGTRTESVYDNGIEVSLTRTFRTSTGAYSSNRVLRDSSGSVVYSLQHNNDGTSVEKTRRPSRR